MQKKIFITIGLLFLLVLVLGVAVFVKNNFRENKKNPIIPKPEMPRNREPVYCTQDAKQCDDGSFVGRIPPGCEFAPCPEK